MFCRSYSLFSLVQNKALSCLLVMVRGEPQQIEGMTASLDIVHRLWNRMDAAQVKEKTLLFLLCFVLFVTALNVKVWKFNLPDLKKFATIDLQ